MQSDGNAKFSFLSNEWDKLGVQHQITCPYTSE